MRHWCAGLALAAAAVLLPAGPALAHPHVWAEARLEVMMNDKAITSLRHVWLFDDLFTATVITDFDTNGDNTLDETELAEVGETIRLSIADFDYFQSVQVDGKDYKMVPPTELNAVLRDGRLLIFFESATWGQLPLAGTIALGVFDPTFYTAIDYASDADLVSKGLPEQCERQVVRPDPDKLIEEFAPTLDQSFYDTTDPTDLTGIFATRLELKCGKATG